MDAAEYVDRARRLAPALRERAAETERHRRLLDATVKELHAAGLFRALQPTRWGGFELDPRAFYAAGMELGAACGSTAWVFSVLGVHPWQMALFPLEAQQDVWGSDPEMLISSSYAPTGQVDAVAGGFRLRGTWHFSSGCEHAGWVFLGGIADEQFVTFLLPRDDYAIRDVWHTIGLAGTGSQDIVVEDAFVPAHRTLRMAEEPGPGCAANPAPLFQLPFPSVFSYAITAPALGMAQGALDAHQQMMRERVRHSYGGQRAREDPFAQLRLSQAATDLDAARLQLERDFEELMACVQAGDTPSMELRLRVRRDQTHGTGLAIRAVDRLFENSGGHALFLDNPIQRAWRDVHAARVHAINDPERIGSVVGGAAMGIDPPPGAMI